MKYFDYPDLKAGFSCPTCGGDLYDVTEYFELNEDTYACEHDNMHNFSFNYIEGYQNGINKQGDTGNKYGD